ncbi:MAG: prepilin-type N-terminal cleavage/methylation domain-containing protein [Patescibacteria group bacterium]|nr:prepilin-type N-terminal cleavage/methylation domain-containing protein [Patescibacteria group bacterium]
MKDIKNFLQKGFTLVELLIVIALLGALIMGLIASLDPIEQIRRGQDTGIRNTASEFFNAVNRYYTNRGTFPWGTSVVNGQVLLSRGADVTTLMEAGELKNNFWDRVGSSNLSRIFINSTSGTDLSVCFMPISKSMQENPETIYGSNGLTTGAGSCKSQMSGTAGTNCYMCFR